MFRVAERLSAALLVVKRISNLALKKESYSYKKLNYSSYSFCASSLKITMRVRLYPIIAKRFFDDLSKSRAGNLLTVYAHAEWSKVGTQKLSQIKIRTDEYSSAFISKNQVTRSERCCLINKRKREDSLVFESKINFIGQGKHEVTSPTCMFSIFYYNYAITC